jgi:hypothetical protein
VARLLIDKGADVDKQDNDGRTALYVASERGHLDVARLLIDKGADVDKKDNGGFAPVFAASLYGHLDVARLLIDNGADTLSVSANGRSTLALWNTQEMRTALLMQVVAVARSRLLAFAMGFHETLGAQSRVRHFDKELVDMILENTDEHILLRLRAAIKCVKLTPTPFARPEMPRWLGARCHCAIIRQGVGISMWIVRLSQMPRVRRDIVQRECGKPKEPLLVRMQVEEELVFWFRFSAATIRKHGDFIREVIKEMLKKS